mmetsp:Transcript_70058/g.182439  ORF Transcript_70058/g.182439 Transcript_70058/m.182439 type:complete len:403 (-) Transcript_70058:322-1530(-)
MHKGIVVEAFERALRQEVLEVRGMLRDEPPPLLLDDDLPLGLLLLELGMAFALGLALLLVHLPTQLDEPVRLALMQLGLHPALVLVHLLDPIVLGELLHQLPADELLLIALLRDLLVLEPHLVHIGVLHLLLVLQLLPHLHLLASAALSLELLEVQVVAEELQLLGLLVFRLHLAQHAVQDTLLLFFDLLFLGGQSLLVGALVRGVLLDAPELLLLVTLHGLLLVLLVDHELPQGGLGLRLLLVACLLLHLILGRDFVHKLLDLVLLLHVLLHGILPRRLLHRDLLLVDGLDTLTLLVLLHVQFVLQLYVLQALVLHVLRDVLLPESVVLIAGGNLEELLGPLLVHLGHVQAILKGSQFLGAVADPALLHVLAQLLGLAPRELLGEMLLERRDLVSPGLFLL